MSRVTPQATPTAAVFIPLLVPLLLFLALSCGAASAATSGEGNIRNDVHTRNFLNTFKRSFKNFGKVWKGDDFCKWSGVMCDEANNEVSLLLVDDRVEGKIPNFDGTFQPQLVRLASVNMMGDRKVTGAFPAQWGQLSHLRSIILNGTQLSGTLPVSWANLENLNVLEVSDTKACGDIPDWDAARMRNLQWAGLANNPNMRGTLSAVFGTFSDRVFHLDLTGTNFCGCVPTTWKGTTLRNAANSLPKVSSANCLTDNKCTDASMRCRPDVAVMGRSPLWMAAAVLAAVYLAV